jgi:hypothetical protein
MRNLTSLFTAIRVGSFAVLIALVAGLCVEVAAQGNPGQNAVCTSASGCSSTIGTSAFIDASVLLQSDICTTIYNILQPATYSTSVYRRKRHKRDGSPHLSGQHYPMA